MILWEGGQRRPLKPVEQAPPSDPIGTQCMWLTLVSLPQAAELGRPCSNLYVPATLAATAALPLLRSLPSSCG